MTGLEIEGMAGTVATWVAAAATLVVFGGLLGERRLFGLAQMLLAGLLTGYLVILAIGEVLVPRLIQPLAAAPTERLDLWPAFVLAAALAGARYIPRPISSVPIAFVIAGIAAFALGGAVVGTLLPQTAAGMVVGGTGAEVAVGLLTLVVTALVAIGFLHGVPRGRALATASGAGRWLLVAGLGGWLGYLLVSRLSLVADRVAFLLFDWLGVGR
jgi:hypothetical protein